MQYDQFITDLFKILELRHRIRQDTEEGPQTCYSESDRRKGKEKGGGGILSWDVRLDGGVIIAIITI